MAGGQPASHPWLPPHLKTSLRFSYEGNDYRAHFKAKEDSQQNTWLLYLSKTSSGNNVAFTSLGDLNLTVLSGLYPGPVISFTIRQSDSS